MPRRLDDDGDLVVVAVNEPVEGHRPTFATVAPTNKYLAQINKSLLALSKNALCIGGIGDHYNHNLGELKGGD